MKFCVICASIIFNVISIKIYFLFHFSFKRVTFDNGMSQYVGSIFCYSVIRLSFAKLKLPAPIELGSVLFRLIIATYLSNYVP